MVKFYFDDDNVYHMTSLILHCDKKLLRTYVVVKKIKCEPGHEKTGFLHMRKQRRRSASR